jgi:hypothetical protein
MNKCGIQKSGAQRYRCKECGRNFTDSDRIWGSLPQGEKPMTSTERSRKSRARKKKDPDSL